MTLNEVLRTDCPHTQRQEHLLIQGSKCSTIDYSVTPIKVERQKVLLMEMQPIDRFLKINREETLLSVHDTSRSLVRGLAHEIKNPLGGIRGAAQLLDQEITTGDCKGETKELCQIIITEVDRLRNLVDRLLGPNQLLDIEQISIHKIIEHVIALIQAEVQDQITIHRDYDPSIPSFAGDGERLIQAILNIARNAMQALLEHRVPNPVITFKTRVHHSFTIAGKHHKIVCKLGIIDNGPGIPEDIKERIFFPMISDRNGGSGLGLTIAQTIISSHQGMIKCQSEQGNTCFSICLPIEGSV
jgi:two-component system nitrogen regulation sensor histidine kinase GlnL